MISKIISFAVLALLFIGFTGKSLRDDRSRRCLHSYSFQCPVEMWKTVFVRLAATLPVVSTVSSQLARWLVIVMLIMIAFVMRHWRRRTTTTSFPKSKSSSSTNDRKEDFPRRRRTLMYTFLFRTKLSHCFAHKLLSLLTPWMNDSHAWIDRYRSRMRSVFRRQMWGTRTLRFYISSRLLSWSNRPVSPFQVHPLWLTLGFVSFSSTRLLVLMIHRRRRRTRDEDHHHLVVKFFRYSNNINGNLLNSSSIQQFDRCVSSLVVTVNVKKSCCCRLDSLERSLASPSH